jgi:hypothetical protein
MITFTLTKAEVLAAYKMANRPKHKEWIVGYTAYMALFIYAFFQHKTISLLLWLGFCVWIFYGLAKKRRQNREFFETNVVVTNPIEVSWSDEGYDVRQSWVRAQFSWHAVVRWQESDDLILIFMPDKNFNVLPKRAFTDAVQLDDLRGRLIKAVSPAIPLSTETH